MKFMKKLLLTSGLFFGLLSNAFSLSYQEFSKEHTEIKKYEKVLNLDLGKSLTKAQIEEKGFYIEGQDYGKNIQFYKSKKIKN